MVVQFDIHKDTCILSMCAYSYLPFQHEFQCFLSSKLSFVFRLSTKRPPNQNVCLINKNTLESSSVFTYNYLPTILFTDNHLTNNYNFEYADSDHIVYSILYCSYLFLSDFFPFFSSISIISLISFLGIFCFLPSSILAFFVLLWKRCCHLSQQKFLQFIFKPEHTKMKKNYLNHKM